MWVMRESNVANAAKESAQDEFPHGPQELCQSRIASRKDCHPPLARGGAFGTTGATNGVISRHASVDLRSLSGIFCRPPRSAAGFAWAIVIVARGNRQVAAERSMRAYLMS
jgi:hypothetical protein